MTNFRRFKYQNILSVFVTKLVKLAPLVYFDIWWRRKGQSRMTRQLNIIIECYKCNKLSLDPWKSDFVVGTNKILAVCSHLSIGSDLIKEVSNFDHLWEHVDTRLKLIPQIEYKKLSWNNNVEGHSDWDFFFNAQQLKQIHKK